MTNNLKGLYARYSKLDKIVAEVKTIGNGTMFDSEVVYGCRESDFEGDYAGKIAVILRGACKFEKKIHNAAMKDAIGVVVINTNPEGTFTMSIGGQNFVIKV